MGDLVINITDSCHWEQECIANSVASILLYALKGLVPKKLIDKSAFKDSARCTSDSCTISINDYSMIKELNEVNIKEGTLKALKLLDIKDIPALIQLLMSMDMESGIHAIDESVGINLEGRLGAEVNEALGVALYSVAAYESSINRFTAAALTYKHLGEDGRAKFMEAMSKVARAEDLRAKALRMHDEGKHDIEEKMIEEASRFYVSSITNFRESVGIQEARANEVLSMLDSREILANYYFMHGDITRAMQYYNSCREILNNVGDLNGDYWVAVKIKGNLCTAFYLLCKAIEENDWRIYEEAGDKFLDLINEGLIDELTTEGAVMSYKSALDYINEINDAVRIYSKYVRAVSKYFDIMIEDRYGNFDTFIREFREDDRERIASILNTDVNTLSLYVVGKVLIDIAKEEGSDENTALETLAYLAGLGLNPLGIDVNEAVRKLSNLISDETLVNKIKNLLLKVRDRLNQLLILQ
ncbi:MAG: hypothetical protein TU36_004500 [Vulcanisaeta sp. AZ3]